jgi:hypothetical protein
MKVLKKYNQHRRDCWVDLECEGCGDKETYKSAYDDRNFWDNVVPEFKCKKCGESTNTLGAEKQAMSTKYPEGYQV